MSRNLLVWCMYSLASLLLCIWLAWHLSAKVNFLYPLWYSLLSIDATVSTTAPNNLYKPSFSVTDKQEHHRIFAEIVQSIQARGQGLSEIQFFDPQGNNLGQLLTEAEIIHLQDVANFVSQLNWISLIIVVACLLLLALFAIFRIALPRIRRLVLLLASMLSIAIVWILIVGPTKVFYWFHPIVFPKEHQWFFYYEESIMSMIMKAPALFAPIAVQLVLIGLVLWVLHLVLLQRTGLFR